MNRPLFKLLQLLTFLTALAYGGSAAEVCADDPVFSFGDETAAREAREARAQSVRPQPPALPNHWVEMVERVVREQEEAYSEDPDRYPLPEPGENLDRATSFVDTVFDFATSFLILQDRRFAEGDTRVHLSRYIDRENPPLAWAVLIHSFKNRGNGFVTARRGAGLGLQYPIIGSRNLTLAHDEGTVVLRVFPVFVTYEYFRFFNGPVRVGQVDDDRIQFRPAAELEATYRGSGVLSFFQPGVRVFAQTRVPDFTDYVLMGEVFANIRLVYRPTHSINVIPRCRIDLGHIQDDILSGLNVTERRVVALGEREIVCSFNLAFRINN